jgi:hypothetical protein
MPRFPEVEKLPSDYDHLGLMNHLEDMYVDTHNVLFIVAILAICDEYGLPLNDHLASKLSRCHLSGILQTDCEGRDLQKAIGLEKPGKKRRQFEQLWDPASPQRALWYPQVMIDLVERTQCASGKDINEAFREVGELLGYSPGSVRQRYYHAKEGLDFVRRIDSPEFNNSYNDQLWDASHDVELSVPTARTN